MIMIIIILITINKKRSEKIEKSINTFYLSNNYFKEKNEPFTFPQEIHHDLTHPIASNYNSFKKVKLSSLTYFSKD